ncbi:MAG: exo-alpha-sialidase [Acidobacteria bacterium]|nr:exo-alpha-sialidase [Acidobacteriota bacterium]
MLDRRAFLLAGAAALGCGPSQPDEPAGAPESGASGDLVESIAVETIWDGPKIGKSWFHPRACRTPDGLFMNVQTIYGSDGFGPVHWSTSTDAGRTWSEPEPVPGLGRKLHDDGVEEGVCDTVPTYHPQTRTILSMGWNVYYKDNVLTRPNEQRWPVYVVRRADGTFSTPQKLPWDDPEAARIYGSNCSQRVTLPNGDLIIPLTFANYEREDRLVATVRATFDGESLAIQERGNTQSLAVKRGLVEPSVVRWGDAYWMTIRAEDGHGYVTRSDDGLQWEEKRPWTWTDGEPLEMSTTQQHWLDHSDALYLVYTRKDPSNLNVVRWRAPLWMARFDPDARALVRESERIVVPMSSDGVNDAAHTARLGNFHVAHASPQESLVTVGESIPDFAYEGRALQARIRWNRPNKLADV